MDLHNNQLTGSIPTEIGNLTNLTGLHLECNQLTGTIPAEIENLTNLTYLDLHDNNLSGAIPPEVGNLTNLTFLDFGGNQLSDFIPLEIGNLTNLTGLSLWSNQLTGSIPPEIGNLANLRHLHLYANQLSGSIPIEISILTNLKELDLSGNQLTGSIPATIGDLTNLTELHLHNNEFTDLPNLSSIDSLKYLKIEYNRFTFEDIEPNIGVPSETFTYSPQDSVGTEQDTTVTPGSSLTVSVSIGGEHNQYQWNKDGSNIGTQSSDSSYTINPVDFADAGDYTCEITNTIATELTLYSRPITINVEYSPLQQDSLALIALYNSTDGANWTNNTNWLSADSALSTWYGITVTNGRVTELVLEENNLVGTIPSEIGNLTNLGGLHLYYNQLTGSIPPEVGNLTNLTFLSFDTNQLTGLIPPEIGNLTNLTILQLEQNQLTGSIPPEIGNLTNLTYLNIGSSQLTGSITPEIGNLANLQLLRLDGNQLTGSIPSEIGNLTSLYSLDLLNNQLTGTIPPEIGNLTNLTGLYLRSNQLTGSIPHEIGNLINLTILQLEQNQLSGSIPIEIRNLANLGTLDLSFNQLTGSIPIEISNLTNLQYLTLEANQLTGSIPPEIGNMTNLNSLSLENNQLTGSIPPEIGNLINLTFLDFWGNQLSGFIPSEIVNLTNLSVLDLGANQLTGSIPIEIGNLMNLNGLRLCINQLSGSIPPSIGNLTNLTIIRLEANQLTGAVPNYFTGLTELVRLWLYSNQLIDLPDLSLLDSLNELKIENNKLTFEDIDPNIGVPLETFTYSPQDSVGTEQDTTVNPGSSLTVSVTVGGANNQYQWNKDEAQILGATDSSYTIDPMDFADAGAYTCEITNTVATELTLYSRPINVTVFVSPISLSLLPDNHFNLAPMDTINFNFSAPIQPVSIPSFININSKVYGDFPVDINLTNDNKTISIKPVYSFPLTDTISGILKQGLTDTSGYLIDYDGDGVIGDFPIEYYTLLPADYNLDNTVDFDDLVIFRDTWWNKNQIDITPFELHPFQGQLPNVVVIPDNIYAYDELMTFVYMWNWSHQHNPPVMLVSGVSFGNQPIIEQNGSNLLIRLPELAEAGQIVIQYQGITTDINCATEDGSTDRILLKDKDVESSQLLLEYAYISKSSTKLITLDTKALTRANSTLTVYYTLYSGTKELVGQGSQEIELIAVPNQFALHQNYPNPFNPVTTIEYDLPEEGLVKLAIIDILGRQVVQLTNEHQAAGYKSVRWNGQNNSGKSVSTGVYFYFLESDKYSAIRKLVILK